MNTHKLYKFRSVNINNLTALTNNNLWFSSICDFNDPFEGAYIFDKELTQKDIKLLKKSIQKASIDEVGYEKYSEVIKKLGLDIDNHSNEDLLYAIAKKEFDSLISIIHNTKCISMSQEDEEHNPICENLLWSHYSDGLRGFCLMFDGDALLKNFCYSESNALRSIKVSYQNQPKKLKLSEFIKFKISNEDKNSYIQKVTKTIATKSCYWNYENEVRFIAIGEKKLYSYKPKNLIGSIC